MNKSGLRSTHGLRDGAAYLHRRIKDVAPVDCPCGKSTRLVTREDTPDLNLHVTQITEEARTHYHLRTLEVYHVIEGTAQMEVAGDLIDVAPGDTVVIPPGTRHRGVGRFKAVIVGTPAFQADDEHFDDAG